MSHDGRLFAATPIFGSNNIVLHQIDKEGQAPVLLRGNETDVTAIAFHPQGDVLASTSKDGSLRLWTIASRRETQRFAVGAAERHAIRFSPDGKRLLVVRKGAVVVAAPAHAGEAGRAGRFRTMANPRLFR